MPELTARFGVARNRFTQSRNKKRVQAMTLLRRRPLTVRLLKLGQSPKSLNKKARRCQATQLFGPGKKSLAASVWVCGCVGAYGKARHALRLHGTTCLAVLIVHVRACSCRSLCFALSHHNGRSRCHPGGDAGA
jgi:hypothetical protein